MQKDCAGQLYHCIKLQKMKKAEIIIVLDKSGSMESIRQETISGFNEFLESQHENNADTRITLVQFNHRHHKVYESRSLNGIEKLNNENYTPEGLTALLDAIGITIQSTRKRLRDTKEKEQPDKVLFIIITDGLENNSTKFAREKIFKKIKKLEEKHSWEFIYLGANQDAIQEANNYGINSKRAMTFAADAIGTHGIYEDLSSNIHFCLYEGNDFEFSKKQRDKQKRNLLGNKPKDPKLN